MPAHKFIFKKLLIFSLLSFATSYAWTQTMGLSGQTRAVVIGISDYQDERIPDLKFAHRDAEAFAKYLQGTSGGGLTKEQIRLLTNKSATAGQIFSALDWLVTESGEGDKVIIYFAGHGDVETKTIRQRGYLLAHDTPANNYRIGAIGLEDIDDILATLSEGNKAEIVLITDACHSGQLAGNRINGTQATAAALMNQFAKEVKIMSCQPDEYALEGEQWGGGRGLFSYHLIEGMIGLADQDQNEQISLREIERYLEDEVSREAAPARQTPVAVGNKTTKLAFVNAKALAELQKQKSQQLETMAAVGKRTSAGMTLLARDSTAQELYAAFERALEQKNFLPSDRTRESFPGPSASELFDTLIHINSLQALKGTMKRNFAAALQEESQQAIIAYLNTNPEELDRRYQFQLSAYDRHPDYLAKATELLGESHYLRDKLLAKRYYFAGLVRRLQAERHTNPHYYSQADSLVQLALKYDDQAAFIHNELGMIQFSAKKYREAIPHFEQAMNLTPTWIMPRMNLLISLRNIGQFSSADSIGRSIHEINPYHAQAYLVRASIFRWSKAPEKELAVYLEGLEAIPDNAELHGKLGLYYSDHGQNAKAKVHLEKAIELNPEWSTYRANLGYLYLYWEELDWREALPILQKAVELDSTNHFAHFFLAEWYRFDGQHAKAIHHYKKHIYLKPGDLDPYIYVAYEQMYLEQFAEALETLQLMDTLFPENMESSFGMACWHSLQRQAQEAMPYLEEAVQRGMDKSRIEADGDLANLRQTAAYQILMERLFPE